MPASGATLAARAAWHVLALASCLWGFSQLPVLEELTGMDMSKEYGGHYQFLTMCSLFATVVAMGSALVLDAHDMVLGAGSKGAVRGGLALIKALTSVVALPVETLVSILFWSILSYDPSLLVPPVSKPDPSDPSRTISVAVQVPLPIDLALHALPAVWLIVDYLAFSPPFSPRIRPAYISALLTAAYCAWAERCATMNGHYPYPLLDLLGTFPRLALYGVCALLLVGVLRAVTAAHRALHGTGASAPQGDDAAQRISGAAQKAKGKARKAL